MKGHQASLYKSVATLSEALVVMRENIRFPRRVESTIMILLTCQISDNRKISRSLYVPIIILNKLNQMQVQPPSAKFPRPLMTIHTLKIRTCTFTLRRNIPTPTTFISHKWSRTICLRHQVHKVCIGLDAIQTVVDCKCGAFERRHELGHGELFILREDQIGEAGFWHVGYTGRRYFI